MEQHLNVLSQALNKANQAGAFNLQESAVVAQALGAVIQALGTKQPNPIEMAREEAKARAAKDVSADMGEAPTVEAIKKDAPNDNEDAQTSEKK